MPRRKTAAPPAPEIEEETLEATPEPEPEEEAPKPKRPARRGGKRMGGEDFAAQPLAIAVVGTGLGKLSATALGPQNAFKKEEAFAIANGLLRITGRHFLKNVDMQKLAKANGDMEDVGQIAKALGNYIARRWQENAVRREQEALHQEPTPAAVPTPAHPVQNGHMEPPAPAANPSMFAGLEEYSTYMGGPA